MTETYVYIQDMRMHAFHGVMPQERIVGNDYIINMCVAYPWTAAAATDDVADTLSYAALADLVRREMLVPSNLLETVASRIVNATREVFPETTAIHLDIRKVAPPIPHDVQGCGVVLDWKC